MATRTSKKKYVQEPKPMFHVGEVRFIKQCAEKFLIKLSEVGDDCEKDEWLQDASLLCDEYVLKMGREMGIQHYEEIMRILLLFIDMHNSGKKIGIGVERPQYEAWIKYQRNLELWSKSDFERRHPRLFMIAEILDRPRSLFMYLRKGLGYA